MAAKRDLLLRRIAAVLGQQPKLSYQQLAERVGVSRRTLYRLAPSREALMEVLRLEAVASSERAVARAQLASAPPIAALERLTQDFLADADLYLFWVADTWTQASAAPPTSRSEDYLQSYRQIMVDFFERGQRDGLFRDDLPAQWLIQVYDSLFSAANNSRQSGSVIADDLPRLLIEIFLRGTAVR